MSELETLIREALHSRSDEVLLRSTSLRSRRSRSFAPLLAAAVVLVLALATVIAVAQRRGSSGERASGGGASFVGYSWRLVSMTDALGTLPVAATLDTTLSFSPNGEVVGSDTVNALSGHFRVTADGYTVSDVASTAAGFAGGDRDRQRIITAVSVCFYTYVGSTGEPHATVAARVNGDTLTLSAKGFVLTYHRIGPKGDNPTPAPTGPASADVVGYRWDLTAFTDSEGSRVVTGTAPWISFPSATSFQGDDTVNGFGGKIHLTEQGFTVSDVAQSAVGVGGSAEVVRTVDAVDAVPTTKGPVTVSLDGHTLTLTTGGVTLVLDRGPVVMDPNRPTGSTSPS